eukprot:3038579-Pyramimonas_sp.AAC.1
MPAPRAAALEFPPRASATEDDGGFRRFGKYTLNDTREQIGTSSVKLIIVVVVGGVVVALAGAVLTVAAVVVEHY